MTGIIRWDPFRELAALQERMNTLFEDASGRRRKSDDYITGSWIPAVDVRETKTRSRSPSRFRGGPKDVEISVENSILTLKGCRNFEKAADGRPTTASSAPTAPSSAPSPCDQRRPGAHQRRLPPRRPHLSLPKREEAKPGPSASRSRTSSPPFRCSRRRHPGAFLFRPRRVPSRRAANPILPDPLINQIAAARSSSAPPPCSRSWSRTPSTRSSPHPRPPRGRGTRPRGGRGRRHRHGARRRPAGHRAPRDLEDRHSRRPAGDPDVRLPRRGPAVHRCRRSTHPRVRRRDGAGTASASSSGASPAASRAPAPGEPAWRCGTSSPNCPPAASSCAPRAPSCVTASPPWRPRLRPPEVAFRLDHGARTLLELPPTRSASIASRTSSATTALAPPRR